MGEENKQPNNLNEDIKVIHTYTSDMADMIRDNEMSVIKIALAEKDKREQETIYKEASGTTLSKFSLIIGGVVLIGIAVVATYFVINKNKEANAPQQQVAEIETFISYNEKTFVDTTYMTSQIEISDAIKKEVISIKNTGSIKAIFLTRNVSDKPELLPLSNLIALMEISAPEALVRNLDQSYMIGAYQSLESTVPKTNEVDGAIIPTEIVKPKSHLFLIFQIKDYNQVYASMLAWEKTMLNDLFIPFNIDVGGDNSNLFEKSWSDIIINNKDVRVLNDNLNKNLLYYIFVDKKTLVITDSQDTIKEIGTRLFTKETKPL